MSNTKSTPAKVQFVEISPAQAGQRIDNFLLNLEKGVPKSRIYRALRKGEVRVNKGRIKQTYKIQAGDIIRVPPLRVSEKTAMTHVHDHLKQRLTDAIIYEDEELLALNKPSGLAVHAGSEIRQGVIEAMRLIRSEQPFLELVHRLDRDTSGCLLLAKSRAALLALQQQMQSDQTDKRYLSLVKGKLTTDELFVEQPLLKNSEVAGERLVQVNRNGKASKTLFIAKQTFANSQLVEVKLFTGRTHQIRVHSAFEGHPVAGDEKYGDRQFNKSLKTFGLKRLFLHAWRLSILHPKSNETLILEAQLPEDLSTVINLLEQ